MTIIYLLVALISLNDETLILFFLISPPLWLAESHWFIIRFTHPSNIPMPVFILAGMLSWALIGLLIDSFIVCIKNLKRK